MGTALCVKGKGFTICFEKIVERVSLLVTVQLLLRQDLQDFQDLKVAQDVPPLAE